MLDRASNPSHSMATDSTAGRAQFGRKQRVDSYAVVFQALMLITEPTAVVPEPVVDCDDDGDAFANALTAPCA
ncbi:MAG: hypothetical protein QOF46_308 [Paraburkholderia sp.]|jgi:hypothetical protein|nr:hypothetical protein [Paraburkholderia sp.]